MPFKFPYENGYSTVGRVVQVGPEAVDDFTIGDRVCLGTAHAQCTAETGAQAMQPDDRAYGLIASLRAECF